MTLNLPNLLSLTRLGLIPLFVIAVLNGQPLRALLVFAVAGITDALDGFLARVTGQISVLGTYLDPIADKMLLISAFVMLAVPGLHGGVEIPFWVAVLVIGRDIGIMVLALVLYLAVGMTSFPPTLVSKVNTAAQLGCIGLILLSALDARFGGVAEVTIYLVAALTTLSGLDYMLRISRVMSAGVEAQTSREEAAPASDTIRRETGG